jgi:CheY-like chemotaxis protein
MKHPMTILLAEDDLDDQELLNEAFSGIDPSIEMFSFTTGKKFISHLENLADDEIPDLIILDYNIPEMNGAEILKYLEQSRRYQKVVKLVWSTSDSPLYQNSCLQYGARAYLVKPSNISGLTELARKMLSFVN